MFHDAPVLCRDITARTGSMASMGQMVCTRLLIDA